MIRVPYRRRLHGLGAPLLPDQIITAAGVPEAFSPGTPDATIISVLQSQGQQLNPAMAAAFAAGQTSAAQPAPIQPVNTNTGITGAVTASGQPVSTQTGTAVTLSQLIALQGVPGVFQCVMSDGSTHYCDVNAQPISYTPPAATPATTPAAGSKPTSTVSPGVTPVPSPTPVPGSGPIVVTPSGTVISNTSGAPQPAAAPASSGIMAWLTGSMFGGIPNWILAGGAALFLFSDSGSHRRR